jgi:S-DNA-T family DNA segregation ATPase FtsK/SpoIIIE
MKFLRNIFKNYRVQIFVHLLLLVFFTISLVTYDIEDPSWNSYNSGDSQNLMGLPGSILSDLMMQLFGIASLMYIILFMLWIKTLWQYKELKFLWAKILLSIFAASLFATSFASFNLNILYFNTISVMGITIKPLIDFLLGPIAPLIAFIFGIFFLVIASGHDLREFLQNTVALVKKIHLPTMKSNPKTTALTPKLMPKTLQIQEPTFTATHGKFEPISPIIAKSPPTPSALPPRVSPRSDGFSLPDIDLLDIYINKKVKIETEKELQEKSEALIRVLGDFGIRGNMTDIHQGPVVTLYEFEPSAGTKSSRVIGLSDDIARSLSALSTRIAVMPGKNALGIEIPNEQRQFFSLRELVETEEYNNPKLALPIILGKDLGGGPAVVDLSKMPHLLVAGTTGSGKSVAINAMIISLLYRHTAETCKFIMIDPKMLELSVYQDIPHLLTPVVTEPGKAVVALKWAVKEMENRYRLMSNLGVRNISGYNERIEEAIKTGQVLERTVQTGFDPETGKPIYETIPIEMQPLPFIVVIVDEMADLMLVAGKDIETSIQRLAQMARAAGIHLIMATQRPSVDVITGVIKANFPSRVSFKVTSKIDSRTILGEQGAEQLLGMGDMLYVSSASTISRCHGPFVDDKEVEHIAKFLKTQGHPQYITSVTESDEEEILGDSFGEEGADDDSLYRQALQIVKRDRKVSTSYIQRCLRIGYNRAAIIIERMEAEGIISPPGHTGRREILIGE